MRTFSLIISLFILFSVRSAAQWQQLNIPSNGSNVINSMLADGATLYASTQAGFFKSTNSGLNWTRNDTLAYQFPTLIKYGGYIYGGYFYGVLRSSDEGASWEFVSSGSINESIVKLFEFKGDLVACVSSNATDNSPGVYVSTNGGTAWAPRRQGLLPTNVRAVSIASVDSILFLVAQQSSDPNSRKLYRSTNEGILWQALALPESTSHIMSAVTANSDGLYCLFNSTGSDGGVIVTTYDGGASWVRRANVGPSIFGVTSFETIGNDLYFTTNGGASPGETPVMRSTNNGISFASYVDGLPPPYAVYTREIIADSTYLFLRTAGYNAWRRPDPRNLVITAPATGEVVPAGQAPYQIRWNAPGITFLKIEVSLDLGLTYQQLTPSTPANALHYTWMVPDTLSTRCKIRLSVVGDASTSKETGRFKIKGYQLTRLDANGDYEAYRPEYDGWQFANDSADMWPQSWWSQNHYVFPHKDPYTNQLYPNKFPQKPIYARPNDFPDWPLFVSVYGTDQCYENVTDATYSPTALSYWRATKKIKWQGSCAGFSVSSLLAFENPQQFLQVFPEVGSYSSLYPLPINDSRRKIVNQLEEHFNGYEHTSYFKTKKDRTVRETLQELKDMFLSESQYSNYLYISNTNPSRRLGAHAIVPFQLLKAGANPGLYNLLIYDSNCPGGNCVAANVYSQIQIDSAANTWYHLSLDWTDGRFFLMDPVNSYLTHPALPGSTAPQQVPMPAASLVPATGYIQFQNTTDAAISIIDTAGNSIGFSDSVAFNTIAQGFAIIPPTSRYQPPTGYYLPDGHYSIRINSFEDTVTTLSVFGNREVFSYWRSDAVSAQSDLLSFRNGIEFGNPDAQTKMLNLEAIVRLDSAERSFQILNCPAVQNDSVKVATPDSNQLMFVNHGPQKIYDLKLELAGRHEKGTFEHAGISIPANSSHTIVPDWQNLDQQTVKILVDLGNNGTIDDSIIVANQTTDVPIKSTGEIPQTFALEQNYPNPFNPNTKISFKLQATGFTSLTMYDMLGREVAVLVKEKLNAGTYEVNFNAAGLPSGMYFYKLQSGKFSDTKKMLLIK